MEEKTTQKNKKEKKPSTKLTMEFVSLVTFANCKKTGRPQHRGPLSPCIARRVLPRTAATEPAAKPRPSHHHGLLGAAQRDSGDAEISGQTFCGGFPSALRALGPGFLSETPRRWRWARGPVCQCV